MNLHINCIKGSLLFAFTFLLIFAAEAFGAVTIDITAPANDTTSQTLPELNFTTGGLSNITYYNWNGEGNISGCRNCTSFNTTYGEYANSSEQNLSAVWHFNDNFSTTAYDDSGNNNGTLGNATAGTKPNWTTGRFGPALKFDGANDFVNISDSPSLDLMGSLTIAAWVYPESWPNQAYIVGKKNAYAFRFYFGKPSFLFYNSSVTTVTKNWTIHNSSTPVTLNKWTHIAATYNGSAVTMYVNGAEVYSAPETYTIDPSDYFLTVGTILGITGLNSSYFNGTIDEVAIYNRSLSGAEVQELYNKSLSEGQYYVTVYADDGTLNSTTKYFTVVPPVKNINTSEYFWTIQAAIDNAMAGNTITVAAGTYNENLDVNKSVTLIGASYTNTTVNATNSSDYVFNITADNVNISGFTVTGATGVGGVGIYLYGVDTGNISGNVVTQNSKGIYIWTSTNITVAVNKITSSASHGITLLNSSGCTIAKNIIKTNGKGGIFLNTSNSNNVTNNTANSNEQGIYLRNSNSNKITGNNASSNTKDGITLYLSSSYNNVTDNTANSNTWGGITLWNSSNNNITNNNASLNNGWDGIYLNLSSYNTVSNNTANSNAWGGITLDTLSNYNTVSNNTANSNIMYDGIYLENSSNNNITNNTANSNSRDGIHLSSSSDYNNIINNSFYGNYRDFASADSSSNTITSNLFNNTRASFTYSGNISVNSISPPAGGTPRNLTGIGKYLNVTNTSAAWVFLNISYADVELGETINDTLRMYRHNGSDWGTVNESGMNNVTKYVYANITEFSVFAPLGNDSTPPRIVYGLNTTQSGNYSQNWIFVNVSVNESNLDTVTLERNGKNYANTQTDGTNYWWNDTLLEGIYAIKVYTSDTAGNTNATETITIRLDITPPTITMISPANATTTDNTPLLNATFGETVDTAWISIDGGANQNYTTSVSNLTFDLDQLSDGLHNVTVYANDSVNNLNSTTRWFTVDTTPPNVTIDSPTNQTYDTSDIWINVTAWDNIEGSASTLNVTAELDGTTNNSLTNGSGNWNYMWPDIEDGQHNITIYVNDSAGNMNSTEVVYFTVDTTMPSTTINSPTNTTITDTTPDLNITIDESSNITYSWNGEGNISGCRNCTSYNTTYGEYANASEQNLSAVWHFNENFGNTAYDDSGKGNDGALTGGTSWTTGMFGPGLNFDGGGDYINITANSSLNLRANDNPHTVAVWFKPEDLPTGGFLYGVISQAAGTGTSGRYWIVISDGLGDEIVGVGAGGTKIGSNVIAQIGTWYFTVFVYNGTHATMYVNGNKGNTTETTVNESEGDIYIGSNSAATGGWFNGTIDEVMFFDRNLSAAEIQELYNGTLADAQHNVAVYATDTAGNSNSTTRWFTVDTTPPTITIESPINKTYGIGDIDYKITVNEPLNWSKVSINGTANMTMANSSLQYFNLSGDHPDLPEGTHNATFYVQDLMGYTNQTTVYFTVNISAPNINITSPENTTYGNGSLSYNMTITNNVNLTGARVVVNGSNYILDNSSGQPEDWYNITVAELEEGYYNVTFYADSVLNNTEIVYFTVDTSPPYEITLDSPQNNSNISSQIIAFNWTSYDNISTQLQSNLTINGSVNKSNISTTNGTVTPRQVTGLSDGIYSWNVTTWDPANNSNTSATYYFTVDTIPPNVSSLTPDEGANVSGSVYINVTVSDADTGVDKVYVQNGTGGNWIEMNWSGGDIYSGNWSYLWDTTTNDDGTVTLKINATDFAGASNTTTRNVTADNTQPALTLILPENRTYNYNESLPLNFTATDPNGIDWCGYSLDGNSNATIPGCQNTTFNVSADGMHNIIVWANDSVGNMNQTISYFTVDTTPPMITIDSPPNETVTDNTPDLNASFEGDVSVSYSWDGEGNVTGCKNCNPFNITYGESKKDVNSSGLWHFNERSGSTLTDDSGQGNHGIISGATWTQGRFGSALYFDGSASVEVPDNNDTLDFSVNDSFAIGVWIKTETKEIEFILSKRVNSPTSPGWELYLLDGIVEFKMKNSSAIDEFMLVDMGGSELNDSNWHHVAVTYNGTSKNGSLYVDGNVVDSYINPLTGPTNNSLSLYIGSRQGTSDFNGTIDDVHILHRALSAAEIAAEYNRQLTDTPHNVTVYARDSVGNLNSTTRWFTVDATPPSISIVNPSPVEGGTEANLTITITESRPDTYKVYENSSLLGSGNYSDGDPFNVSVNSSQLATLNYTIWANDTAGNVNSTTVWVTVQDTTWPTWDEPLLDQPAEANMTFTYDVNASDNAIDTYFINDTENFTINATSGVITNNTVLSFGNYSLNISVNDTSGHVNYTVITITVEDTIAPAITITSPTPGYAFSSGKKEVTIYMDIVEPNPDTLLIDWGLGHGNISYGYISNITGPLNDDLSDGGSYTFYVWANDTSGNAAQTETRTFSVKSSSGGDSPGPGPSPTTTLPTATTNNGTAIITFTSIDVGAPATFDVPETENVYITRVFLAVKNKVTDVTLTVSTLDTRPATIEKDATGITYKYLDIALENVNDVDISIAILTFKVKKSWINDNSIDSDSITLNRYSGGAWTTLTTTKLSCDYSYCYYEAGSPGLSVFSISGSIVTTTATTTETTTTLASSTPTTTGRTSGSLVTPAPVDRPSTKGLLGKEGKPINKTVIVVVIVLIIVIAAFMYYRHRKKEGKWWEDQIRSTEE